VLASFRRNVARGCGEESCFDTVHRGLDHRVTVCFLSAIGFGNSNRAPLLLKHDVESRESFVFELSESPDLRCARLPRKVTSVLIPADIGLVALL
jgi:hypothetical protein